MEALLAGYTPAFLIVAATMLTLLKQGQWYLVDRVAVGGAVGLSLMLLLVWVAGSM